MESPQEATDKATSPQPERQWVWRASLVSRAAGKISVLACVETVFAVALYWWIAIRWDTHWHLVSSVFIAPLLLLRSPESIAAGVRWFVKDWFGFEQWKEWPKAKQRVWSWGTGALAAVGACILSYWLSGISELSARSSGDALFYSVIIVTVATACTVALACSLIIPGGSTEQSVITGITLCGGSIMAAGAGAGGGAGFFGTSLLIIPGGLLGGFIGGIFGVLGAQVLRALMCGVVATLFNWKHGLRSLPRNWRENHFVTDVCIPAESLQDVGGGDESVEADLRNLGRWERTEVSNILDAVGAVIFFLPALLYRLNIKATAWFWWPLAFLLRPVKQPTLDEDQKEALCWPWTNPFQKLVFVGISLLALVVLFVRHVDPARWRRVSNVEGVWAPVKALLAVHWSHIPPWHWAILISAVCSVVMLALAGGAVSCSVNKKWPPPGLGWKVKAMEALVRVRSLATVALLLFSLGALFIAHTPWHAHVAMPQSWYRAMKDFYRVTPSPEVAPTPLTPN